MVKILGMEFFRAQTPPIESPSVRTFTQPEFDDGSSVINAGGVTGSYVDLEGNIKDEVELINKYREMSLLPEVEGAVDDVINEVINPDDNGDVVKLSLDTLPVRDDIKSVIFSEFDYVLRKLEFREKSYEIFKKWYVDGRIHYHAVIDEKQPELGILELRYVDPRKIKKIVEVDEVKDPKTNTVSTKIKDEYYVYKNDGFTIAPVQQSYTAMGTSLPVKIAKDSIMYSDSGIMDKTNTMVLSHLHKAIKPVNSLRSLEDAAVIYRLARAPERRIFYIDVGNLPKPKAEQYMRDMVARHKNKLVYDAGTGEVRDDRKFMTMLEDFWLPRREGGRGTEISTLPGGQQLGQMDDIYHFQKKLYKALNVPTSRMEAEVSYTLGRATEINRDEVKFHKFIRRVRTRFNEFIYECLKTQLILKGIMNLDEFELIKQYLILNYNESNYFTELKENELMRERLMTLREAEMYNGKYFSTDWLRTNLLKQSKEDQAKIDQDNVMELKTMSQLTPPPSIYDQPPEGSESVEGEQKTASSTSSSNTSSKEV